MCGERSKERWKFKRAQLAFQKNPYKAGTALLDPQCKAALRVDETTLDHHKRSSVCDKLYDVPLGDLDGLPPAPSNIKLFPSALLKYEDFVRILSTRRNASPLG